MNNTLCRTEIPVHDSCRHGVRVETRSLVRRPRIVLVILTWLVLLGWTSPTARAGNQPTDPPKTSPNPPVLAPGQSIGVPQSPPVPGADPTVRHALTIQVPTKLKIERNGDTLEVSVDQTATESADIDVGLNMLLGVRDEYHWKFAGDTQPQGGSKGYVGGASDSVSFTLGTIRQKFIPGKKYVIEVVVSVFETDLPPKFLWFPEAGHFKVLWSRTLTQTVE